MTDILEVPIGAIVEQPALFCTLYHLSQGCGVIRLTFGEQLNGERKCCESRFRYPRSRRSP
ncbi:MAG TPA: hypothetical protein VM032_19235 [Vicinamibacterales bacterium]|nr:hypothetical protein [Vicinamibacterales bacterium]